MMRGSSSRAAVLSTRSRAKASAGRDGRRASGLRVRRVAVLDNLQVDVAVVLGRCRMPLHMLLRMGRGAVIELEASETDMVEILANDHPIARGQIVVTGNRISVEVTELIRKADALREPGLSIGDGAMPLFEAAPEPL
jgi:flagellar motor switch protein FliN